MYRRLDVKKRSRALTMIWSSFGEVSASGTLRMAFDIIQQVFYKCIYMYIHHDCAVFVVPVFSTDYNYR